MRGLLKGPNTMYLDMLSEPGKHDSELEQSFGAANLAYEGTGPEFDFPLVLVGFTNRSGSNLLCDYLLQTKRIAGLGEHLNYNFVQNQSKRMGVRSFPEFMEANARRHTTGGKLFGVKASWNQMAMLHRWNIPAMFTGTKVIHIRRRDAIGQAVSLSIASQTKKWTSKQNAKQPDAEFKAKQIEKIIANQKTQNEMIELIAAALGYPLVEVVYERLCEAPADEVRRVMRFLGTPAEDWQPEAPAIEKQANETNAKFVRAFHEEIRKRLG